MKSGSVILFVVSLMISVAFFGGPVGSGSAFAATPQVNDVTRKTKKVTHRVKYKAKYAGHETAKGTRWTAHKTKRGTQAGYRKTKHATKHTYHKTREKVQ